MIRKWGIQNKIVGSQQPCFVIVEVAQAHDGSLGIAHSFIDAIAQTGADAVKFQTHIAAAESTPAEPWRIEFSPKDKTRFDYWKRMEFSAEEWAGLKIHAEEKGLVFLSSPFSVEAVELLSKLNISAWKIGSGEVTNVQMLNEVLKMKKPILLSTGMSPLSEIDQSVERIKASACDFAIFQCASIYPTPAKKVGLNLLEFFRSRYKCPVGLSDHSAQIPTGLAAIACGANLLEVHVAFSKEMFGPDTSSSLTPPELKILLSGIRWIEQILWNPINKDEAAKDLTPLRDTFMKSIVAKYSLAAGTILRQEHLALKKPGTGLSAELLPEILGMRLKRDLQKDELLDRMDLAAP